MKFVKQLGLIVIFLGCKNADKNSPASNDTIPTKNSEQHEISVSTNQTIQGQKIGDFISDTTDYFWTADQGPDGSYWIRLSFQEEFAQYQFHGQCIYWFFTNYYYTGTDKIELLWSYKSDCVLPMKFLTNSHGVKKYPKFGDVFSEYSLVNDSIIKVKYNFPEWTEKVNKIANDSLFPIFFYLHKKDGI